MSNKSTNEEHMKIFEEFSKLLEINLKKEEIIDINLLDNIYMKIRELSENKNKEINDWYDEQYINNILTLNTNVNKFMIKMKDITQDEIFKISYS
jgi:hypothetical protein